MIQFRMGGAHPTDARGQPLELPGIFSARKRRDHVNATPPVKDLHPFPYAVIGVPVCTATSVWTCLVKNSFLILVKKTPAGACN
jgi:hypothetical protein